VGVQWRPRFRARGPAVGGDVRAREHGGRAGGGGAAVSGVAGAADWYGCGRRGLGGAPRAVRLGLGGRLDGLRLGGFAVVHRSRQLSSG
jgi:hypothetical protein